MSNKNKGIMWLCISFFIMISIFSFSNQTSQESSSLSLNFVKILLPFLEPDLAHFIIRKMAHFTIYAFLGFSIYRSLSFFHVNPSNIFIGCLLFIILYAGLDEFHQLFVDGRSGEVRDIFIDSCGGCLGIGLSLWLKKRL